MRKFVLSNGLTVLVERRKSDSVAVEVSVGVGSVFESKKQAGLSHFLEHMLFDGSSKRPSAFELSNAIEKLGGELNGGTSNEQTCFYAKTPSKHFNVVLDVLSDMLLRPLFRKEDVEKERKVVLNEIQLYRDDPKLHIWVLLQKQLYPKHPAGNPVYGSVDSIAKFTREDVVGFHRKYYVPGNMSVTVVGNVSSRNAVAAVKKYFGKMISGRLQKKFIAGGLKQLKPKVFKEKRRILQSYLVLAYKTPPRGHSDSNALDLIHAILGRRSSGRMFDEIRNKRALAYEVSVQNESAKSFGFFAVYVIADKKNLKKIVGVILDEIRKLKDLKKMDLDEAKTFLEGDFLLEKEDNLKRAEFLDFFNHASDVKDALNYLKNLRKVSLRDIKKAAGKYLGRNYTLVVVGQK